MFDDDNFWVKLDRDDDEIEFMNNSPTYNGSKYRKTNTQTKSVSANDKQARIVPVTCNVKDDSSLFDKTRRGKAFLTLIFVLPMLAYVFLLLSIIFAIRDNSIFVPFLVLFGVIVVAFAVICKLRLVLNRKYKQDLANKEILKIRKKTNKNKPIQQNKNS